MEEETQEKIQSLKRKTLYLQVAITVIVGIAVLTRFQLLKDYSDILNYYHETQEVNYQILLNLEEVTSDYEHILSILQEP